jgi:hypothetical protein
MTCPNCGAQLDDRSRYCNFCGAEQKPAPQNNCRQAPPPAQAMGAALGGKGYFVLAMGCFAWALCRGGPKLAQFAAYLVKSFHIPSGLFGWVGVVWGLFLNALPLTLHLLAPLVLALVLLRLHQKQENQQ